MAGTVAQPAVAQETAQPKPAHAALAYSGGANSTLGALVAREIYQATAITAVIVDVGQDGATSQAARDAALALGATPLLVDVRHEFNEVWLKKALVANAAGCARSLARQLIAAVVAQQAATLGCDAIVTGNTDRASGAACTAIYARLAPGARVLTPLTQFTTTELAALRERIPVPSVPSASVPPAASEPLQLALTITFEAGLPVRLNGVPVTLGGTLAALRTAGGLATLVDLHRELEASALSASQLTEKRLLDRQWAALVCAGGWYHPQRRQLDAALARYQRELDGDYTLTVDGVGLATVAAVGIPQSAWAPTTEAHALNRLPAA